MENCHNYEGGATLVNGATTGGDTSCSDDYEFALDGTLDDHNRPGNISELPCRSCPVSCCQDFSEAAIKEFCHFRGYEDHDVRILVVMNQVLFHSSVVNIKKAKGKDLSLEDICVAMSESMVEIMDSNFIQKDSKLVRLFYDLTILFNEPKLYWYLMSVLAHAGFDVRIIPAGFGIRVVVQDIDISCKG